MAGPVRPHLEDATGGIVAILEVTGEPDEVFAAYLDGLLEQQVPSNGDPIVRRAGDARVTDAFPGGGGGDYFRLTLVERTGHPTWLAIEGGHD